MGDNDIARVTKQLDEAVYAWTHKLRPFEHISVVSCWVTHRFETKPENFAFHAVIGGGKFSLSFHGNFCISSCNAGTSVMLSVEVALGTKALISIVHLVAVPHGRFVNHYDVLLIY